MATIGRVSKVVVCAGALAVVVAIGAGIEGSTRLTGPRWTPHLNAPSASPKPHPLPSAAAASGPPLPTGSGNNDVLLVVVWVVVGIAIAVGVFALVRWLRQRPPRKMRAKSVGEVHTTSAVTLVPEAEPEPEPPVLQRGVEYALQMLDSEREPADAVIRAWLGLQQSAEDSGILRRAAETPTEFTRRIMSRAFADDRPITTLLNLYLRTRFGDHPVTSDDVARAREALADLARTWENADA